MGWIGYLIVVISTEIDGYEGQPYDAGAVHGEADVLGFVKVLGYFTSLEGVERAEADEDHVVEQREHQRKVGHGARQNGRQCRRVHFFSTWSLQKQPHDASTQLNRYQPCSNHSK